MDRVLLEKLIVAQVVNKSSHCVETESSPNDPGVSTEVV
jgi:hypothetical protein